MGREGQRRRGRRAPFGVDVAPLGSNAGDGRAVAEAEARAKVTEERLRLLADNAQDFIFSYRLPPKPGFDYVSPACAAITGYSPGDLYANPDLIFDMLEPQYVQMMEGLDEADLARSWELAIRRKDGTTVWVEQRLSLLRDDTGRITTIEGIARDVTERKVAEERLARQALHDEVTGLPNRRLLRDRLSQALARAERHGSLVAVVFLDLDHFKLINDSWGHAEGDKVLVSIAGRLRSIVRGSDTVARFGGDEFVVVREGVGSSDDVSNYLARLTSEIQRPMQLAGYELIVNASIGVALGGAGDSPEALLRDADAAMYKAKARGRSRAEIATKAAHIEAESRLSTELALRRSLTRDEFDVMYQPVVSIGSGVLVGVEALVRWRRPDHGLVEPDAFIGIAEETGLIRPLGAWVLHQACRQLHHWRRVGINGGVVSVNLSGRQLSSPDLVGNVLGAIAAAGIPPGQLSFEITESVLMEDVERSVSILRALKDIGVGLAIDDFGTGYSSLSYLERFPVDGLKIDRSFIARLGSDATDGAIVSAVMTLGHALGLSVTAEGVETPDQLRALADLGCDAAQGFLFGRPVPPSDLATLVAAGRAAGAERSSFTAHRTLDALDTIDVAN
ncbi:MAG: EAL domain-containing protein [Acidimicrobiia bacterium]|nr:EAL domain-containing protein [Acidimicrobiia bacterium]